jgi:hypothetical protein
MTDAIGWTPVLATFRSQHDGTLHRVGVFAIAVSALLLAGSPASAIPFGTYVFKEFQNTEGGTSSIGTPAINDQGKIAAVVGRDEGGQQVRVYSEPATTATPPTIIVDTNDPAQSFLDLSSDGVSINNNDTVVFEDVRFNGLDALYASTGGLITLVVDDSGLLSVDGIAIDGISPKQWDLSDNVKWHFRHCSHRTVWRFWDVM